MAGFFSFFLLKFIPQLYNFAPNANGQLLDFFPVLDICNSFNRVSCGNTSVYGNFDMGFLFLLCLGIRAEQFLERDIEQISNLTQGIMIGLIGIGFPHGDSRLGETNCLG